MMKSLTELDRSAIHLWRLTNHGLHVQFLGVHFTCYYNLKCLPQRTFIHQTKEVPDLFDIGFNWAWANRFFQGWGLSDIELKKRAVYGVRLEVRGRALCVRTHTCTWHGHSRQLVFVAFAFRSEEIHQRWIRNLSCECRMDWHSTRPDL